MRAWISTLAVAACANLHHSAPSTAEGASDADASRPPPVVDQAIARARRAIGAGAFENGVEPAAAPPIAPDRAEEGAATRAEPALTQSAEPAAPSPSEGAPNPSPPAPSQPAPSQPALAPPTRAAVPPSRVGAGETGRVLRREREATPLELGPAWIERLVAVSVNGVAQEDDALALISVRDGAIAVALQSARAWRLAIDPADIVDFSGEPHVLVASLAGVAARFDAVSSALAIDAAPSAFVANRIDLGARAGPSASATTGLSFDYDLVFSGGDRRDERLSGLFEMAAFHGGWVLTQSFSGFELASDPEIERLETQLFFDDPARRATFAIGDHATATAALGGARRVGGLSYATNFATDPAFVSFPTPVIGGLAEQESVVELIVDNVRRVATETGPGPFVIEQPPVVTGAGEIQVTVRDLLGRERRATQSYYVSNRLLKEGLSAFGYSIGFLREDFARASFDYGDALATLAHRYGVNDALTIEGEIEAGGDTQSGALGASASLGRFGVATLRGGGSWDQDDGAGGFVALDYEYRGRAFDWGARTRLTDSAFRRVGREPGEVEREDQLRLGAALGPLGRAGLLYIGQERRDGDDFRSLTATWATPVGPGFLSVNAAQELAPDEELAVTASWTLPLRAGLSARAGVETRRGGETLSAGLRQGPGASDLGFTWGADAEMIDGAPRLRADVAHAGSFYDVGVEGDWREDEVLWRANLSGGVAALDGEVLASRRIGRAFGVVRAPGLGGVRVFHDNRYVGKTNAAGSLLVPDLSPYQRNRFTFETDDLPLDAEIGDGVATGAPRARSGVVVDAGVVRRKRATATLLDHAGRPAPAGLRLETASGASALVGLDGFVAIEGAWSVGDVFVGVDGARRWRCAPPPHPGGSDPLIDLGSLTCDVT